jgi:hypothetical protein
LSIIDISRKNACRSPNGQFLLIMPTLSLSISKTFSMHNCSTVFTLIVDLFKINNHQRPPNTP